jgi:hypothetical protein
LEKAVSKKHGKEVGSKIAIGGLIFLRFICPALSAPQYIGLVESKKTTINKKETPSDNIKRTLLLLTKIIINIANGLEFSKKEEYMKPANEIVEKYIDKVSKMLLEIPIEEDNGKVGFKEKNNGLTLENVLKVTDDDVELNYSLYIIHLYLYDKIDEITFSIHAEEKLFSMEITDRDSFLNSCQKLMDLFKILKKPIDLDEERGKLVNPNYKPNPFKKKARQSMRFSGFFKME